MAEKNKSRKIGRNKKGGQNLKYKNERRAEQNKLTNLKRHIKRNGVTGKDVVECVHKLQVILGHARSDLRVNERKRSAASIAWHKDHPSRRAA